MCLAMMVLGFTLETCGFVLAGVGLWRTWRDNADGRDFLSPKIRGIVDRALLRSPRVVPGRASAGIAVEADAAGFLSRGFTEGMTPDQKLDVAQGNAIAALKSASEARHEIDKERVQRQLEIEALEKRVDAMQADTQAFAKRLVVDGVPVAVVGLSLAAFGLLLQAIPSIATFGC